MGLIFHVKMAVQNKQMVFQDKSADIMAELSSFRGKMSQVRSCAAKSVHLSNKVVGWNCLIVHFPSLQNVFEDDHPTW